MTNRERAIRAAYEKDVGLESREAAAVVVDAVLAQLKRDGEILVALKPGEVKALLKGPRVRGRLETGHLEDGREKLRRSLKKTNR